MSLDDCGGGSVGTSRFEMNKAMNIDPAPLCIKRFEHEVLPDVCLV